MKMSLVIARICNSDFTPGVGQGNIRCLEGLLNDLERRLIDLVDCLRARFHDVIKCKLDLSSQKYPPQHYPANDIRRPMESATQTHKSKLSILELANFDLPSSQTNLVLFRRHKQEILSMLVRFVEERPGFASHYTVDSIRLSILAELGELAETVQWKQPRTMVFEAEKMLRAKILEGAADVMMHILHFRNLLSHGCKTKHNPRSFDAGNEVIV